MIQMTINKRGQFYLLTAIIFIAMLFLMANTNTVDMIGSDEPSSSIKILYDNEIRNVINNAIYYDKNITTEIEDFTANFIRFYDDEKNTDISIAYIFKDGDTLTVSNGFAKSITIKPENVIIARNSKSLIELTSGSTTMVYDDLEYQYSWDYNPHQFRSVIIEKERI